MGPSRLVGGHRPTIGQVGRAVIHLRTEWASAAREGNHLPTAAHDPPREGGPTRPRAGDGAGPGPQGGTTAPLLAHRSSGPDR